MLPQNGNDQSLRGTPHRLFLVGLAVFVGCIVFSVAGMLLLRFVPGAMTVFGPYYPTLVKGPTWTFMALLALLPVLMYGPRIGWRRIGLFLIWGSAIGGASELLGTTGALHAGGIPLPFGEYEYTNWLGPKIAGHVPYFIPLSWFAMGTISFDLGKRTTNGRWSAIFCATAYMVLWDVSLDPAMNHAFPFWEYGSDGFFFGMPLSNWFGWSVVSFVIMLGYEFLTGRRSLSHPWALGIYVLNCLFPIAITLIQGSPLAALFGIAATSIPVLVLAVRNSAYFETARSMVSP